LCLVLGRFAGSPNTAAGLAFGAKVFLPMWLIGAGISRVRSVVGTRLCRPILWERLIAEAPASRWLGMNAD
jgi:hypothetical protein